MVKVMKTKIINLQFAFFLKDIVDRPDIDFADLNSKMLNLFDAMPQMIPTPRELPPEVPVIILRSSNASYGCNISRSRIDFTVSRINEDKSNSDLLKDFNAKVSGLIKYRHPQKKQEYSQIRWKWWPAYFHKDKHAYSNPTNNKYFI